MSYGCLLVHVTLLTNRFDYVLVVSSPIHWESLGETKELQESPSPPFASPDWHRGNHTEVPGIGKSTTT